MLEKNQSLAEMFGIILGDGRLRFDPLGRHYQLDIILNYIDETEYVKYVEDFISTVFNYKPKISRQLNDNKNEGKGIYLTIYNKELIQELMLLGLKPGDKVKNQIRVPDWIKSKNTFNLACLKGLFDTDGSVFPVEEENTIRLNFKNGSFPLVKDFKEMSESNGIKTSKISSYKELSEKTGKFSITYIVQIQARKQVERFLIIVKPKKWEFRKENLLNKVEKPFEYKMPIYSENEVLQWISLYEELKSFKKVRDKLREMGKPPRIETIRSRIKDFYSEHYIEWLKIVKNENR
ncbi:MAG: LAGLIDADG family homing endonuclease [Candidatus Hermodarchaeota archaeon]